MPAGQDQWIAGAGVHWKNINCLIVYLYNILIDIHIILYYSANILSVNRFVDFP